MQTYVLLNIAACLMSAGLIFGAIMWRREALLRPSFAACSFLFLFVQAGSAGLSGQAWQVLENPWHHFIATQVVTVTGLAFAVLSPQAIFTRLAERQELVPRERVASVTVTLLLLTGVILAVLAWYLAIVPPSETALYAALFSTDDVDLVREETFKLLDQPALLYAFTVMEKVLGPAAAALAAALALQAALRRSIVATALYIALMALCALPATIYGARGPASMILLAGIAVPVLHLLLVGRTRIRLLVLVVPLIALAPAVAMTMLKEGSFDLVGLFHQSANVAERIFVRGNIANIWHLQFVEEQGFHGIAAIHKAAALAGIAPVDIMNVVGAKYAPGYFTQIISTISANGSFSVLNYAIFGVAGHLLSVVFLVALDLIAVLYRYLSRHMIVPAVAAMAIPLSSLSHSLLTTTLASKGLLLLPILFLGIMLVESLIYRRLRRTWDQAAGAGAKT